MYIVKAAVYIITHKTGGTLHTGVTNNLIRRIYQHKQALSKKANLNPANLGATLVYYEFLENMLNAIAREEQLKAESHTNKLRLIETLNPHWLDLYEKLLS